MNAFVHDMLTHTHIWIFFVVVLVIHGRIVGQAWLNMTLYRWRVGDMAQVLKHLLFDLVQILSRIHVFHVARQYI